LGLTGTSDPRTFSLAATPNPTIIFIILIIIFNLTAKIFMFFNLKKKIMVFLKRFITQIIIYNTNNKTKENWILTKNPRDLGPK
jgi:hypothetical protein